MKFVCSTLTVVVTHGRDVAVCNGHRHCRTELIGTVQALCKRLSDLMMLGFAASCVGMMDYIGNVFINIRISDIFKIKKI